MFHGFTISVNEWLLFNAVIFKLYHNENKLIFDEDDEVRFVLDRVGFL